MLRITLDDLDDPTDQGSPILAADMSPAPAGSVIRAPLPVQTFAPAYAPMSPTRPSNSAGLVGAIIGAVGALVVIIGSLITWDPNKESGDRFVNAFDLPIGFLIDWKSDYGNDQDIGLLLVTLAVFGLATTFIPKVGLIRNCCGGAVLIIAILYLVQMASFADAFDAFGPVNLTDLLGPGFYVSAAGGLMMAAGPPRWR
ncbi:MAG: hypothetical protein EXQ69_03275 [Acidimicrobiia bacterium]|nr:hypothetical protein [Acidimicrobiia bacterium]